MFYMILCVVNATMPNLRNSFFFDYGIFGECVCDGGDFLSTCTLVLFFFSDLQIVFVTLSLALISCLVPISCGRLVWFFFFRGLLAGVFFT